MNEYHTLIKRAQNQSHINLDAQSRSKFEVPHFVSNHVSLNDESFITCLPYGGRKIETLLLFMPKHSALEPVTMTRTGSWKGTLKLPQKKTEWIWGRSPVCHVMPN